MNNPLLTLCTGMLYAETEKRGPENYQESKKIYNELYARRKHQTASYHSLASKTIICSDTKLAKVYIKITHYTGK